MALSLSRSIASLLIVFVFSSLLLYAVASVLSRRVDDKIEIKLPVNVEGVKKLVDDLQLVKDDQLALVFLLFCFSYLFLQTFCIPGSFLLNLFAGAVFGSWIGVPCVCVLSATGASICFVLSKLLGESLIDHCLRDKLEPIRKQVKGQPGASEFLLLISTRLFPATPNWLLNISLPHIGISLAKFYISVLIGLAPYNFLSVQTGIILQYTSNIGSVMDTTTFLILASLSVGLVVLALCLRKHKVS